MESSSDTNSGHFCVHFILKKIGYRSRKSVTSAGGLCYRCCARKFITSFLYCLNRILCTVQCFFIFSSIKFLMTDLNFSIAVSTYYSFLRSLLCTLVLYPLSFIRFQGKRCFVKAARDMAYKLWLFMT